MRTIITGSSDGIGKQIAREVCRRGGFYYPISRWSGVDVSNYESVKAYFEEIKDEPIDALINNAGIIYPGSILELSENHWQEQINTNLNGVFYCCKEFIKMNKDKGGKIINIASTAGLGARPGRSAYAASKAAVISFSLSLAEEVKDWGFKVYCVSPGACNTKLRKQIAPDDDFKNMLQPEEIASFIVDLVENGFWLDNQNIIVRKG
jgi:3-oxoacyl-[acyl-carrier protein] reductase